MDQSTLSNNFSAARALADAGNFDGAIAKLKLVLAEAPDHPYALALMALFQFNAQRRDKAAEAARAALAADAECALAYRVLGLVEQLAGRLSEAEAHFRRAVEVEPYEPYNRLALAGALAARDKRDEAEAEFKTIVAQAPNDANVLSAYADFLIARGDLAAAEPLARRAMAEHPDDPGVLTTVGEIALRRGRLDEAKELALWALQRDATNQSAVSLLCQVKMRRNPVLGVWWLWATWMQRLGSRNSWIAVIGIYIAFQIFARTILKEMPETVQTVVIAAWVSFAVLTWIGPSILRWMINAEMKRVRLKPNF